MFLNIVSYCSENNSLIFHEKLKARFAKVHPIVQCINREQCEIRVNEQNKSSSCSATLRMQKNNNFHFSLKYFSVPPLKNEGESSGPALNEIWTWSEKHWTQCIIHEILFKLTVTPAHGKQLAFASQRQPPQTIQCAPKTHYFHFKIVFFLLFLCQTETEKKITSFQMLSSDASHFEANI